MAEETSEPGHFILPARGLLLNFKPRRTANVSAVPLCARTPQTCAADDDSQRSVSSACACMEAGSICMHSCMQAGRQQACACMQAGNMHACKQAGSTRVQKPIKSCMHARQTCVTHLRLSPHIQDHRANRHVRALELRREMREGLLIGRGRRRGSEGGESMSNESADRPVGAR